MSQTKPRVEIKTLTAWRALWVAFIVLYHYQVAGFNDLTRCGVAFFFISSGFLSMWHYGERERIWWRSYVWRHARKIYPLHWLTLAVVLALNYHFRGISEPASTIAANALLLQAFIPVKTVYYSINTLSWFLSALMFCYALFPLLIRLTRRLRLRYFALTVTLAAVTIAVVLSNVGVEVREYLYVCPVVRLLDFLIGMLLWRIVKAIDDVARRKTISFGTATALELLPLILVAQALFLVNSSEQLKAVEDSVVWWLPMSALIVVSARLDRSEGAFGRLLLTPPLMFYGRCSFETYILQSAVAMSVAFFVFPLSSHFGLSLQSSPTLCYVVALAIAAPIVHKISLRCKM